MKDKPKMEHLLKKRKLENKNNIENENNVENKNEIKYAEEYQYLNCVKKIMNDENKIFDFTKPKTKSPFSTP